MKKYIGFVTIVLITVIGSCSTLDKKDNKQLNRSVDFNFDWKFTLLDEASDFDDPGTDLLWREVRLPHDWSIEHSFDSVNGDGATAYLPGGKGVYKKTFNVDYNENETIYILFDGVYNNSEVWLNGTKLGFHPYGYSPFYFDISDHLKESGAENVIEVKVDRSRYIDSRWYPGSGIYRNVKLVKVHKLHIPIWGTILTTPTITEESAQVNLSIEFKNNFATPQKVTIHTTIIDDVGNEVAHAENEAELNGNGKITIEQNTEILSPKLWDIDQPEQYTAITSIDLNGDTADSYSTQFGIREFHFDKNEGFFLNGINRKIKGVCLHHDAGLTGVAVPLGVWKRRLNKLKEAGCNAIRIAHNPASDEFLDLCDKMGFLVQEEFFDEWDNPKDKRLNQWERHDDYISRGYAEYFQEWAEKDLKATMKRSRNHPSIFQWSIGNEIEWTYPRYSHSSGFFNMSWDGNYFWEVPPISHEQIKERYDEYGDEKYVLAKTAKKLADWTREMDTSRPVIANCILPSVSHESGYTDALDIVGYSYRRIMYDYGHENYPDKVIMGTENLVQWHEWKSIEERPFISGTFFWTGIDYMGEAHGGWPRKGTSSGMLDMAGFEKPSFHMIKSLWNDEPHVHIVTQTLEKSIFEIDETTGNPIEKNPGAWEQALWTWHDVNEHWNYNEGEMTIVEVYSNCEQVELFLNNQSLGVRNLADAEDHILKWAVPHVAGTLKAIGKKGSVQTTNEILTALEPVAIQLSVDKQTLSPDGYDVGHVVAQLIDSKGNPVRHLDKKIAFSVEGDVKMLGVDNGAADNIQDLQSNELVSRKGRALLIVQSNKISGKVIVKVAADKLKGESLTLTVQ